jgi:hypothetical protein
MTFRPQFQHKTGSPKAGAAAFTAASGADFGVGGELMKNLSALRAAMPVVGCRMPGGTI